jgi:protein-L-isoaspartate(D-aspartate) O-methyltransferase
MPIHQTRRRFGPPRGPLRERPEPFMLDYAQARRFMVDCQLRTVDVNDIAVLDAFTDIPRERFVPPGREDFAYIDQDLAVGPADGETRRMLAPAVLARLVQALAVRPGVRALDVGSGLGFSAAVLARLGADVVGLESDAALAAEAATRLAAVAGRTIPVRHGALAQGAPDAGPFGAILVNGTVETRPQALLDQLADGGRLTCVVGRGRAAKATLFVRSGDAVGARPLFDAAAPVLEAFKAEAGFVF